MEQTPDREQFTITDDNTADWALTKIQEEEAERDRLVAIAEDRIVALKEQIDDLNKSCDNKTAFFRSKLAEYFQTVPHKESKTQESYKLLSGKLVLTKPSFTITHDDERLLEYLDGTELVRVTKKVDWSKFKKDLEIIEGNVVDTTTGEIVDGCSVEEVPAKFTVKF